MSLVLRQPIFCIWENKGSDQRLSFRYIARTIPLLSKFEASSHLLLIAVQSGFVSDLVRNPADKFSHNMAHLITLKFKQGILTEE